VKSSRQGHLTAATSAKAPCSSFAIGYVTLGYLPKVAIHLGLVAPMKSRPVSWASKHNRTARAYALGPIVEPQQDRYLRKTLQQKERLNISIKEPFHDSRIR
jgi:hypothetical protein